MIISIDMAKVYQQALREEAEQDRASGCAEPAERLRVLRRLGARLDLHLAPDVAHRCACDGQTPA